MAQMVLNRTERERVQAGKCENRLVDVLVNSFILCRKSRFSVWKSLDGSSHFKISVFFKKGLTGLHEFNI